jgi:Tol biopolymer transport system component
MRGGVDVSRIEALDLESGARTLLVQGGVQPRYAASGHLVYAVQGALQAVAFDAERLELRGDPVPVVAGVVTKQQQLAANFAISASGALVFEAGEARGAQNTLVWVDRQGREEPLGAPPRAYYVPRLSPDGSRVALWATDQEEDIWIWDLARQTLSRLTSDPAVDLTPVWTPDGRRIVFSSRRASTQNLYVQAADGTGVVEPLTEGAETKQAFAITPDGSRLVYRRVNPGSGGDLHVLSLTGAETNEALVTAPLDQTGAELSPDGRWLAYRSNESGSDEIYVRPFPNVDDGRWLISSGGGTEAAWARNGRELFYIGADGRLMAVPIEPGETTFSSGTPTPVLERSYFRHPFRSYDVAPDGRRFLMIKDGSTEESAAGSDLVVVLNWFEDLERLAGAGTR